MMTGSHAELTLYGDVASGAVLAGLVINQTLMEPERSTRAPIEILEVQPEVFALSQEALGRVAELMRAPPAPPPALIRAMAQRLR